MIAVSVSSFLDFLLLVILLGLSGLLSGLTMGLMSLSVFELKRKCELGDTAAKMVYPIRARGNELLVSLIIGNVLVNSAIAVLLEAIMPGDNAFSGLITVIFATALITFFGEILPQSLLIKHGLSFSAMLSKQITFYLNTLRPISKPIAKVLDRAVGRELPTIYSTDELVKILEEHEQSQDSDIEEDELRIVRNALEFGDRKIGDIMTPKSMIAAIEKDEVLSLEVLKELHESGHSRFPVYDGTLDKIIGILFLRDLIDLRSIKNKAGDAANDRVYFVNEEELLDHALNAFLKTRFHLYIVVNEFSETVGLVTIEDIIEEIMGQEIVDEFDKFDDLREVALIKSSKKKTGRLIGDSAESSK